VIASEEIGCLLCPRSGGLGLEILDVGREGNVSLPLVVFGLRYCG